MNGIRGGIVKWRHYEIDEKQKGVNFYLHAFNPFFYRIIFIITIMIISGLPVLWRGPSSSVPPDQFQKSPEEALVLIFQPVAAPMQ
jgi:hypothetical protein